MLPEGDETVFAVTANRALVTGTPSHRSLTQSCPKTAAAICETDVCQEPERHSHSMDDNNNTASCFTAHGKTSGSNQGGASPPDHRKEPVCEETT